MHKLRFLVACLLVVGLVIGCAGTKPPMDGDKQQLSKDDRPDWVNEPGKESNKNVKAFAGISRQFAMERDARQDAKITAFGEALTSMGTFGKMLIEQASSNAGIATSIINPGVADNILSEWKAKGGVLGDIPEWHIERWREFSDGRWNEYYVATCLFLMPRDAAKQFAQQILEQQAISEQDAENQKKIQAALEQMERLQTGDW